jgi:two-component system, LuxR family, sensor kinase FixL
MTWTPYSRTEQVARTKRDTGHGLRAPLEDSLLPSLECLVGELSNPQSGPRPPTTLELDLVAQHRLMTTLIRSTTDGIIVIDAHGKVLLENPAWRDITGYSAGPVPPDDVTRHFGLYRTDRVTRLNPRELACHRALHGETIHGDEIFLRNPLRPEGRWLSQTASPLRDDAGTLWGAVSMVRDVTSSKAANVARLRLAALVQTSGLAIAVLDLDGMIQEWNPGAEQLFGYGADEIVGRPVSVLPAQDYAADFGLAKAKLLNGLSVYTYETVSRHRDGTLIELSVTLAPIKNAADQLLGFYAIGTDIRARRRLEQHLANLGNEERQNLGRELHDTLGQQLTGIALLINALKEPRRRGRSTVDLLTRLESSIEEAKMQIRNIAKGISPVDIDAQGLSVALDELVHKTQTDHGLSCRFEAAEGLWVPNNLVATQLYFIAREGVTNAVLHAHATRIVVQLLLTRGGLRLVVQDNGRGMPPDAENGGGTGLGIMRHRCGLIGGVLRIKKPPGGGVQLVCYVPH